MSKVRAKPPKVIARDAKRQLQYTATLNISIPHDTDRGLGSLLYLTEDFEIEESLHIAIELLSQGVHGKKKKLQVNDTMLADLAHYWLGLFEAAMPEAMRRAEKMLSLKPA